MNNTFSGTIRDIAVGIYDGPHATPPESGDGPIFLGIENLTAEGRVDFSKVRHISEQYFPEWTRRVVPKPGDIVFSYEATLHRYGIIPEGFRGCLGRRLALIRPDTSKVDNQFLFYYLLSPKWRGVVESNIITGATVDRVPLKNFPSFPVQMPTLVTQKRIANVLSSYDSLIENNRRRIELLEQAARLLYKEWFVHFRFPGHEHVKIVDGVPGGWKRGQVSDFGEIITGKTPSTKEDSNFGGDIPFVKTPDMHDQAVVIHTEQKLSESGAHTQNNKYIPRGSLMVSCIGTLGVVSIASQLCQTNQQINSIVPYKDEYRYYAYFLLSGFKQLLEGMGGGATMGNVNKTTFSKLQVVIPSNFVLQSFHDIVSPMFAQIETLERTSLKLTQARDLLLPRLMNGEIAI